MLSVPYLCRAMSVASFSVSTETYGSPESVANVQGVSIEPVHDTDELKILGAVEENLSVLTSMDMSVSFGGFDWTSLAIMAGTDNESSGQTLNINEDEGGTNMPYFGAALAFPLQGGREMHVYVPKCQLQSRIPIDVSEQNQFSIAEIDIKAMRMRLSDGTVLPIRKTMEYDTTTELPSNFNTAFGIS